MIREQEQRLPLAVLGEIDALCTEFEDAWRAKQAPRIESYLERVPAEARFAALVELIGTEADLRIKAGESLDPAEYLDRFPRNPQEIDAAFDLLRRTAESAAIPSEDESVRSFDTSNARNSQGGSEEPMPEAIGRYRIQQRLGRGAFGAVYLACDPELDRLVAVKLPRADRAWTDEELERFLEEARTAVRLEHPGIVPVHDVFRMEGRIAVVQKYIDGRDLATELETNEIPPERSAELLLTVCDALAFAHRQGVVHRDLKPGNLLLDEQGKPYIADFGLAVHESLQRRRRNERSGTPAYMSPEQVRGETHRLDGRSDIWSLGAILYEMLTGRRPFSGERRGELFDEIKYRDPRPPRQINPRVPAELERICLKCLSKRVTDRYSSAVDLADELRDWLAGARESLMPAAAIVEKPKVLPKGLRSFGEEDADFFLDLLPGPRGRDGLPESIRFWKARIEETDPDKTFPVGLIYGPSGCGKTSLVKAGLLPRLASHVVPIYVEATPADTETRLLRGLRNVCHGTPGEASLPELFESLRAGQWLPRGKKLTIVLDQFEQWLHAHGDGQDSELVQTLRHCDGGRVQCVALVRDDFFMATSRFMQALEIQLVEGRNMNVVDLFDPLHAAKVLSEFGRAYGRLPEDDAEITSEQRAFIDGSVAGLCQDNRVICVRLALLADMMKGRPWTSASLREVGGTSGLGITFLEETFSAATSPAQHRFHQQAARAVLRALLPESGTDIKGGMRSYDALLQSSGYARRPRDFAQLVHILDTELRLITPTEPAGIAEEDEQPAEVPAPPTPPVPAPLADHPAVDRPTSPSGLQTPDSGVLFFQLTHDYLVPSLRQWLTRKQQETRRGRAELRLDERASNWNAKTENQQLPAWWEYLNIRVLTDKKTWTEPQRRMMRRASKYYGVRWAIGSATIVIICLAGIYVRARVLDRQIEVQKGNRADRMYQVAINAGERGDWDNALRLLGEAERLGPSDPLLVRFGRIKAFEARSDVPNWKREIDALTREDEQGPHGAEVLFWQGQRLRADGDEARGLSKLSEAIERGLPSAADVAYARAMLSENSAETLRSLLLAVDEDPFHHGALVDLTILLAFSGELAQARERAAAAMYLFPGDPHFPSVLALVAMFEKDGSAADRWMDYCKNKFDCRVAAQLQMYRHGIDTFNGIEWTGGEGLAPEKQRDVLSLLSSSAASVTATATSSSVSTLSIPKSVKNAYQECAASVLPSLTLESAWKMLSGAAGQPDLAALSRAQQYHPDALFPFLRGASLFSSNRPREAEAACLEALRLKTPWPEVHRYALLIAAGAAVDQRNLSKSDDPDAERAASYIARAVDLGTVTPPTLGFAFGLAKRTKRFELAGRIVDDYLRARPDDGPARQMKAEVDRLRGFLEAASVADRILARDPHDILGVQLRDWAKAGLGDAVPRHADDPSAAPSGRNVPGNGGHGTK